MNKIRPNRKFFLIAVIVLLASRNMQAQSVAAPYWLDSLVVPASRMPQFTEFLNHQYPFPAKPRSQWELGFGLGNFSIHGDVPAVFPTPGFSVHVRKALGYVVSLRANYMYGIAKGLTYKAATNFGKNTAWTSNGYRPDYRNNAGVLTPAPMPVYYNYKSNFNALTLDGVFSLTNINYHKRKSPINVYFFVGAGINWYETKINALDQSGQRYAFNSITASGYSNRRDIYKILRNTLDDSYETPAESEKNYRTKIFGQPLILSGSAGLGAAWKLSSRINLFVENRFAYTNSDLLDGQRWAEQASGDAVLTRSRDGYNYGMIGLNFNLGKKSVEPLWWINPLDYPYSELSNPRHMKLPQTILTDSDGDGVGDQFDQEPGTPAGCPVDAHGVSRDTDGDGVPDCKDRELITPTQCQPVDAYGVGRCQEPACCKVVSDGLKQTQCQLTDMPPIIFKDKKTFNLGEEQRIMLGVIAYKLRENPECRLEVQAYSEANKKSQQLAFNRVKKIIHFLVEKEGISGERLIPRYEGTDGDLRTVDFRLME